MKTTDIRLRDLMDNYGGELDKIKSNAEEKWLSRLGRNGYMHSRNIEENLNMLIPDEIKKGIYSVEKIEKGRKFKDPSKSEKVLWEEEIFVLLSAVYLHDIGFILDTRLVREGHEKRGYDLITSNYTDFSLHDRHEAKAVAEVCYGHADESECPIKKISDSYACDYLKNKPVNLRTLAALLRLADDLDSISFSLAGVGVKKDGFMSEVAGVVPMIRPDQENWRIRMYCKPNDWNDIRRLERARNYLQGRLDDIREELEKKKMFYYQIWIDPADFNEIYLTPKPNEVELDEIKELAGNLFMGVEDKDVCGYKVDVFYEDRGLQGGLTYRNAVFVNNELDSGLIEGYNKIFKILKEKNEIDKGLIVVKKGIDGKLINFIPDYAAVVTIDDVIQKTTNLVEYLKKSFEYHCKDVFNNSKPYVSLRGCSEKKEGKFKVDDYLDSWLNDKLQVQLTILGDVVTGKSTIAKRLFCRQAERYFRNPGGERIPVFIELKDYKNYKNLEDAILGELNRYLPADRIRDFRNIKHLNDSGRILMILDGFEDTVRKIDSESIYTRFREIDRLVSTKSKVVITSRTEYFISKEKLDKLYPEGKLEEHVKDKNGYDIISLRPFEQKDIECYLEKFFGEGWNERYTEIKKIYDLSELARKPILLELIAETLKHNALEKDVKINTSTLYGKYTGIWLEHPDVKGCLNIKERKITAEEIAVELFLKDSNKIHIKILFENIKAKFYGKPELDISALERDLTEFKFLSKDENGFYSFIHKSFMEFFTAKKLAFDLESNNPDIFSKKFLYREIIDFLSNLVTDTGKLYDFILSTRGKPHYEVLYLGRNAISVLNALKEDFSGRDLSNTLLNNSYLNKANFSASNLKEAVLDHSNLNSSVFRNANLKSASLQKTYLKEADFEGANLEGAFLCDADLRGANLENANLCDADLRGANLENANLKSVNLKGAKLDNANLSKTNLGNVDLKGVNLELSNIQESCLMKADLSGSNLSMAKLNDSDLKSADLHGSNLKFSNFMRADLRDANLQDIRSEFLEGTDFREADLRGANLKNFNIIPQLKGKVYASEREESSIKIRIRRKTDITGMKIKDVKGLSDEEIKFLKDKGAVDE